MAINDIMGHWYKCDNCDKEIPIPDFWFINQDGEKTDIMEYFCPFCEMTQLFILSDAEKPCTEKEAHSYLKIEQQKRDGKIRIEWYWENPKK